MRLLRGFSEERPAVLLRDALSDSGIDCELKVATDGRYALWVLDETNMAKAQGLAERWLDGNEVASLEEAARRGRIERELKARIELRRTQETQAEAQRLRTPPPRRRPAPLTWGLIAMCVGIAVLTDLGD